MFQENWGEGLTKVHQPVVCVLDIETSKVEIFSTKPYDISPGQVWSHGLEGRVLWGLIERHIV